MASDKVGPKVKRSKESEEDDNEGKGCTFLHMCSLACLIISTPIPSSYESFQYVPNVAKVHLLYPQGERPKTLGPPSTASSTSRRERNPSGGGGAASTASTAAAASAVPGGSGAHSDKERKIGHRRVDEAGQVSYKKVRLL